MASSHQEEPVAPAEPGASDQEGSGLDRVGIRQVRAGLSGLVQRAAGGERIVITVDGRPTAQLGPLGAADRVSLDDLAAAGLITSPRTPGPLDTAPPPTLATLLPADVRLDTLLDQIRGRR
jgi:prevent-host-death family protein